ncbi:hypothetical protein RR46_09323 [Papilio xuthus]|uniref:Uncharacterized protein n=1 Tax=Papilio xuthus TaxID=66420 RepID=A0A194PVJ8_PAPXU|nr:hypothetical protein RR46_09323 [Papilio xuthus]
MRATQHARSSSYVASEVSTRVLGLPLLRPSGCSNCLEVNVLNSSRPFIGVSSLSSTKVVGSIGRCVWVSRVCSNRRGVGRVGGVGERCGVGRGYRRGVCCGYRCSVSHRQDSRFSGRQGEETGEDELEIYERKLEVLPESLREFIFACFLALAAAKPGVFPVAYTAPVAAAYTAPVAAAYTAPLAYSAYSAYTAPVAAYSAYPYASPYAAYYLRR